jgi:alpha-beta hydrolase superfamily lysophospholipase
MATPSPTIVPAGRFLLTSSDGSVALRRICGNLPICLFSGGEEPVGRHLRRLQKLIGHYRDAGLRDIAFDFYPGGRHEMLNEINRRQVQINLLGWISRILEKRNDDDRPGSIALELQH